MAEPIDPESIAPQQKVKFQCPIEGCGQSFVRTWMPKDTAGRSFGESHCYMHGMVDRPVMVIVEVTDG